MQVLFLAESVNPVYRRRRIAKVLKTAKKHRELMTHWSGIENKHNNDGRAISRKYFNAHGSNFGSWPDAAKKKHNAEHDRNVAKRTVAYDKVIHHMQQRDKAYKVATGRYELPDGSNKHRVIPSNPLRKNRDETLGKHNRTPDVVKQVRAHDIEAKAGFKKFKAVQDALKRAGKKD